MIRLEDSINNLSGILDLETPQRPDSRKTTLEGARSDEEDRKGDDSDSLTEGPGSWDKLAKYMEEYETLTKKKSNGTKDQT